MNQIEVAIAVIQRGCFVLICQRRKKGAFADLWEFPGGKIERDERPEQGVIREVREELGIEVKIVEKFPLIDHPYPSFRVCIHPYLCEMEAGEPQPLAAQRLEWVEPPRLTDFAFPEANAPLLAQIIGRMSRNLAQPTSIDFHPAPS